MSVRFAARGFSDASVRRSVLRTLRENVLCSIATVSAGNRAHINTAYFAYSRDLELFFLSNPRSTHCRNLARNPSLAMTIFDSAQSWVGPDRGIQLFGRGGEARGRFAARAARAYGARFPAYPRWVAGVGVPASAAELLRSYRFYRFTPRAVKVLDEARFPGVIGVRATLRRAGGRRR